MFHFLFFLVMKIIYLIGIRYNYHTHLNFQGVQMIENIVERFSKAASMQLERPYPSGGIHRTG